MCKFLWLIVAVVALTFVAAPCQAQASWPSQAMNPVQYPPGAYYNPYQGYAYQGQSNYYQPGFGYYGQTYQTYSYPQGYGNYQTPYFVPQYQGYGNYLNGFGYPSNRSYYSYYNNPQWHHGWRVNTQRQYRH